MVDFSVSDDLRMICDSLGRFIETEIEPIEKANAKQLASERTIFDDAGRFTPEILVLRKQVRMKSAEAGFYTMTGPEELGGAGLDTVDMVRLYEFFTATTGPGRLLVHPVVLPSPFTNGLSPVLTFLNPDVRADVLPAIASGEKTLCFALSEPDAGSDVFAIKTRAVRDGNHWVLNGTKQWITNGPYADYAMLFAITNPEKFAAKKGGITGFLIDTTTPGFDGSTVIPVLGHQGGDTAIITLEDVRVPDSYRLGEIDEGFKVAMHGINRGRLGMAAGCLGFARWGLEQATEYAKTRKTFGKPIGEHQAVQMHLAEAAMEIYAAKNMILNCAWRVSNGLPARKETSMVKAYSTEMLNRVMDRCIQVHGGMGLTNDLRLEAGYRFARIMRIPDGTGEIQRRTIARELLYGDPTL